MNIATHTAPPVGISFADLLRYNESEAAKWRAWFESQPLELLDVPFGNAAKRMENVREMIRHIFLTESVYACILNGDSWEGWNQFPHESVDDLFAIGNQSRAGLTRYLAQATDSDMSSVLTLAAGEFTVSGSARKFLTHTFVHSMRHWAQLATVLRQHGHETSWPHDLVLSDAIA